MSHGEAANMRRTFNFALLTIISLFVIDQTRAATIWEDFSQESERSQSEPRALRSVDTLSGSSSTAAIDLSAIVPATYSTTALAQVQLPSMLNTPNRNAGSYRLASMDSLRMGSGSSNRVDTNRRIRRNPIVRTEAPTTAAAIITPDAGNTVLLMGGALALLLSILALRLKKLASQS